MKQSLLLTYKAIFPIIGPWSFIWCQFYISRKVFLAYKTWAGFVYHSWSPVFRHVAILVKFLRSKNLRLVFVFDPTWPNSVTDLTNQNWYIPEVLQVFNKFKKMVKSIQEVTRLSEVKKHSGLLESQDTLLENVEQSQEWYMNPAQILL